MKVDGEKEKDVEPRKAGVPRLAPTPVCHTKKRHGSEHVSVAKLLRITAAESPMQNISYPIPVALLAIRRYSSRWPAPTRPSRARTGLWHS